MENWEMWWMVHVIQNKNGTWAWYDEGQQKGGDCICRSMAIHELLNYEYDLNKHWIAGLTEEFRAMLIQEVAKRN